MKIITAAEWKKRLDKDEVLLIDAHESTKHRSECIGGACFILPKIPLLPTPLHLHLQILNTPLPDTLTICYRTSIISLI